MKFSLSVIVFVIYLFESISADFGNINTPVDYGQATIQESDVSFFFYRENTDQLDVFTAGSKVPLGNIKTKFIIHDYGEEGFADWAMQIKEAYFMRAGSYNVFDVEWYAALTSYEIGAANTKRLGEYIAQFIIDAEIDPENVHVIGSGLGGQAAGHVGKHYYSLMAKKINRITGLDVAGPKFEDENVPAEDKLHKSDAVFVDVIHTNARNWGYKSPIGFVDYYPNGGNVQPGCTDSDASQEDPCSHARAAYFYAESINSPVEAAECTITTNIDGVVVDTLPAGRAIAFGEVIYVPTEEGAFTFSTNDVPPYLIT